MWFLCVRFLHVNEGTHTVHVVQILSPKIVLYAHQLNCTGRIFTVNLICTNQLFHKVAALARPLFSTVANKTKNREQQQQNSGDCKQKQMARIDKRAWLRASFTKSLCQRKPSLALKLYCQVLLKTHSDQLALRRGQLFFCAWPYWICICRSFPFRRKSYGRSVFKWIMQRDLLTFALVKLLAFALLFNAQKKHVLNYFALEMAAIIVARGGTAENREHVVEGRGFFPHVLI